MKYQKRFSFKLKNVNKFGRKLIRGHLEKKVLKRLRASEKQKDSKYKMSKY